MNKLKLNDTLSRDIIYRAKYKLYNEINETKAYISNFANYRIICVAALARPKTSKCAGSVTEFIYSSKCVDKKRTLCH